MRNYHDMLDACPETTVVFGKEVFSGFELLLRTLHIGKLAVFTGRDSAERSGAWQRLLRVCAVLDIAVSGFKEIEPEPEIATVDRMTAFLRRERPDAVVAIGGGSPMDAAKAAYLVYQGGGEVSDYFGVNRYSAANQGASLRRVICFPTTSGTGSEATPYANIVDRGNAVKKLIVEDEIVPAYAFVEPRSMMSMPRSVTLATGCDALAHSLEGFLNIRQDDKCPEANDWALESIRLIVDNLPKALADGGNYPARAAMAAAATLGGMVIRYKSTGLPHLCSFSWFGRVEHGIAVAMLLPAAWEYYIQDDAVRHRTLRLREIFPGDTPEQVVAAYRRFLDSTGVPRTLGEVPGITPELLEATAAQAGQNKIKLDLSPRAVPLAESRAILGEILRKSYLP